MSSRQGRLTLFDDYTMYYIQTLKQELSCTRAYKEVSAEENSEVNDMAAIYRLSFL